MFYWTPPHFWALALNKQRDYASAGVPMAPLVWGERETRRQMVWYTVILLALTVLPWTLGVLGGVYLACAVALGVVFLASVVRVAVVADFRKAAWWVYGYSLLYLALLFSAMVVDRALA